MFTEPYNVLQLRNLSDGHAKIITTQHIVKAASNVNSRRDALMRNECAIVDSICNVLLMLCSIPGPSSESRTIDPCILRRFPTTISRFLTPFLSSNAEMRNHIAGNYQRC